MVLLEFQNYTKILGVSIILSNPYIYLFIYIYLSVNSCSDTNTRLYSPNIIFVKRKDLQHGQLPACADIQAQAHEVFWDW